MPLFQHGDIALEAPADWQDQSSVVLVGPLNAALKMEPRVSVTRQQMVHPQPARELARSLADNLTEVVPGAVLLENESHRLSGADAHRIVFRWKTEEAPEMTRVMVFVTRGTTLYVVMTEAWTDAMPSLRPQLDQVLRSFRFVS